jgi:hypothetical protein
LQILGLRQNHGPHWSNHMPGELYEYLPSAVKRYRRARLKNSPNFPMGKTDFIKSLKRPSITNSLTSIMKIAGTFCFFPVTSWTVSFPPDARTFLDIQN